MKPYLIILHVCFSFFTGISFSVAQTAPTLPGSNDYFFQFLTFKADRGEKSYVEILAQLPVQQLLYQANGNRFESSYAVTVDLMDANGVRVDGVNYQDVVTVPSEKLIPFLTPHMLQFPFLMEPGIYKARIAVADVNSDWHVKFTHAFMVRNYGQSMLKMSDIQLCSRVEPAVGPGNLVKNNLEIEPNVQCVFARQMCKLYLYAEVYNLLFQEGREDQEFSVTYFIRDEQGDLVKSLQLQRQKPGMSSFVCLAIPIANFLSGRYTVQLQVRDLDSGQTVRRSAHFSVLSGSPKFVGFPDKNGKDRARLN